jgi:ABC-type branched-subunit amino acid transport system permease subunit
VAAEYWLSSYLERWQTALGVALILVVLFAPRGIVGGLQDLAGQRPPRPRKEGS